METEKALAERDKMGGGGNKQDVEDRKARLLANRDKLRKLNEEKR